MSSTALNGAPTMDPRERLLDLLTAQATQGLSDAEQADLSRLLQAHPDVDPQHFELAAAATALALFDAQPAPASLPADLRTRLVTTLAAQSSQRPSLPFSNAPATPVTNRRVSFGWFAAAAALILAVLGWYEASRNARPVSPSMPTLAAQFDGFKLAAADMVHYPWEGKEAGFQNVKGEVYWSDRLQQGYMLLSGLPANDPAQKQYQLWIVDPARDKHPVDGGVFDIATTPAPGCATSTGETIVPIDCKLGVTSPAAFALTVEKPGGVVVSAGPLVVVAAPKKG